MFVTGADDGAAHGRSMGCIACERLRLACLHAIGDGYVGGSGLCGRAGWLR